MLDHRETDPLESRRPGLGRRLGAVTTAVLLIAAACGTNTGSTGSPTTGGATSPSGSPAGSPAADISGDLTVWGMGNEGALMQPLADAFMKEYPNVKVSITPIAWDQAVPRLLTAIGGDKTPDVSQMGTDMMGQFVETGGLEEVPASFKPDAFFESAWNTGVVDGKPYSVPWYVETRVLYYRTDTAEAAGITKAPETWDELKAMATALKGKGGAEWGISLGTKNSQEYLPFLWSNGGDVLDESGKPQLNSAQAVEALTFYDSFFEEGLSPTQSPEGFDITPAFVSGTHPMFISGPWHLGLIEKAGGAALEGKWAIAPLPKKESATSFVGGSNLVVFKESQNKDAAWAFVEFLSRPDTQVMWYEEATVLPSVQVAWEEATLAGDENVAVFGQQLDDTRAPPAVATWSKIGEAINAALEKLTTGDLTPQAAADEMQKAAEGALGTN